MKSEDFNKALNFQENLIELVSNPNSISEVDYSLFRDFIIERYPKNFPNFLKNCRTLKNFQDQLISVAHGDGSWKVRREFIYKEFENFLNYLEFGEDFGNNTEKIEKGDTPIGISAGGNISAGGDIIVLGKKINKANKDFNHGLEIMKTIYWIIGSIVLMLIIYLIYSITGINLNIK